MGGFMYVEYRSRKAGVDLEYYRRALARKQARWQDFYPDDILILNVGRSWRIGPEPEYMMFFYVPEWDLERLSEWTRIWRSGETFVLEANSQNAGRIDRAGCYTALTEPIRDATGPYYAEYFDVGRGASDEEITNFFQARQSKYPQYKLVTLLNRIGMLGPEPRGIAWWSIPEFGVIRDIATELDPSNADTNALVRIVEVGLYDDLGLEIL